LATNLYKLGFNALEVCYENVLHKFTFDTDIDNSEEHTFWQSSLICSNSWKKASLKIKSRIILHNYGRTTVCLLLWEGCQYQCDCLALRNDLLCVQWDI